MSTQQGFQYLLPQSEKRDIRVVSSHQKIFSQINSEDARTVKAISEMCESLLYWINLEVWISQSCRTHSKLILFNIYIITFTFNYNLLVFSFWWNRWNINVKPLTLDTGHILNISYPNCPPGSIRARDCLRCCAAALSPRLASMPALARSAPPWPALITCNVVMVDSFVKCVLVLQTKRRPW